MTSLMIPASQTSAHPCPCGCAECAGGGCGLECLEHPRFFCGQLLTDQDLTALVSWSQAKFRLGRFRHGWGIVCGLEVTVDAEYARSQPDIRTSRVVVSPGYAVSCCGDDLVLCQPETIDLAAAFENGAHQCQEPRPPARGEDELPPWRFGGLDIPRGQVRVVDLVLQHKEQLISPQPALGQGASGQQPACNYSRAREVAKVDWRCSNLDELPAEEKALDEWRQKYQAIIKLVDEFEPKSTEGRTKWLRERIVDQPLRFFRFVRDMAVSTTQKDGAGDNPETSDQLEQNYSEVPENHPTLLFWLIQERRNVLLRENTCPECPAGENLGVPLARVWLRAANDAYRRRAIDVLHIDAAPSFRRSLSVQQRWLAPPGEVNLTQFLWQSPEAVRAALGACSIDATAEAWELNDLDSVRYGFGATAFAPYKGKVTMYVFNAGALGERVIGFS